MFVNVAGCPRFASVFWSLTWAEEGSGRPTGHFQLTIPSRPFRFDSHQALDRAFVIIDRQDPYGGNVAPLTAECYSESRFSTRKIAGREPCVEPAAHRRHSVAGKQSQPQAHASQPRPPLRNVPRGWGQ